MLKSIRGFLPILAMSAMIAVFGGRAALANDPPNVKAVQDFYEAFGKGDLSGLVAGLSEDVRWEVVGRASDCPCMGVRSGKAGVAEFFQVLGSTYDVSEFSLREFHGDGDKVFVLGHYAQTNKATKKGFDSDFVHVFTFKGGKVSAFQEYTDTAKEVEANRN